MGAPRKSFKLFVLGRVLYFLLGFSIFLLAAFLVWRVYISDSIPREMKGVAPNAALKQALTEKGELTLFTEKESTVTRTEENYGYFGVPRFVFAEEAKQVQVVFRYNNSTLKNLQPKLAPSGELPRGEEIFTVSLSLVTDLTPEDLGDNTDGSETLAERTVTPSSVRTDTTALYTYFFYTFDGVDVNENDLIAVFFDIGWEEGAEILPLGTLRLYHRDSPRVPVKLKAKDRRAILAYEG